MDAAPNALGTAALKHKSGIDKLELCKTLVPQGLPAKLISVHNVFLAGCISMNTGHHKNAYFSLPGHKQAGAVQSGVDRFELCKILLLQGPPAKRISGDTAFWLHV